MDKKIIIGIGILIVIGLLFFLFRGGSTTGNIAGSVILDVDDANVVKIPLSEVSEKARWYSYNSGGIDVEYFVVGAKDGSVKTAFDACDVCYGSKKGYRQQGDDMICNNCGNYYPISGLGTKNLKGGGCWPGYLPSEVQGDYLIIKKTDLETGRYRFK